MKNTMTQEATNHVNNLIDEIKEYQYVDANVKNEVLETLEKMKMHIKEHNEHTN